MVPLSVLHVINCITPTGGAEVSTVQTLPRLASAGLRQAVVSLHPPTDVAAVARMEAAGVQVLSPDTGTAAAAVRAVRAAVRAFRPDLVHSVLWEADRAARPAARLEGVPAVTSLVNAPVPGQRLPPSIAWKASVLGYLDVAMARHLTAGFHAITETVAQHGVHRLGVPRSAITVVPRGRDRDVLGAPSRERRTRVRELLDIPEHVPVLLNVGRQERQKGQDLLLEAFVRVLERVPMAVLLIAGRPGANTLLVEQKRKKLGLGASVQVLGARGDVPDLLCAADLFVFSSLWEGLGGSVLEAMALEVPVVAFDVPAVAEVLAGTGRLVATGDVEQLALAVIDDLQDPAQAGRRASAARVRFEEEYSMESVVQGMLAFYARHARPRAAA